MAEPIVDDLADMMTSLLVAQPGTLDGYGAFTAAGDPIDVPCYLEGGARQVRDSTGQEVVSSVRAICGGVFGLTTNLHRYTLPVGFSPRLNLTAIAVDLEHDENGPHHETVVLP